MPHDPDVRPTSHDRHDPMLVAALAAGDLAGTDRDQAITLTDSCSDCASLHADLLDIVRATAAVPPPFASPGRDFRITPAQAARLRPAGWRRFLSFGRPLALVGGPVGAGLATIGIVGLLIGNLSFGFAGSAASAPQGQTGGGTSYSGDGAQLPVPAASGQGVDRAAPGASAAPASAVGAPAATGPVSQGSNPPAAGYGGNDSAESASPAPNLEKGGPVVVGLAASPAVEASHGAEAPESPASQALSWPSPNLLFGAAIVIGLGLILASRRARTRPI